MECFWLYEKDEVFRDTQGYFKMLEKTDEQVLLR